MQVGHHRLIDATVINSWIKCEKGWKGITNAMLFFSCLFSGCVGAWTPKWFCPFSVVPAMVKDGIFSGLAVEGRAVGVSQINPVFLVMYISVSRTVFLSTEWTHLGQSHVAGCKHSAIDPGNGEHFALCPSSQFCSEAYWIHLRVRDNLSEDLLGWGGGVRSGL